MFPSFNNEDENLYIYSDNFSTNPISTNHENLSSTPSEFNYFPCSSPISYSEDAMFFQQFHDKLHQSIDDQEMVNYEVSDISTIGLADDKFCSKNSTANNKVNLSSSGGSKNQQQQMRRKIRRCKKDRHSKIVTANGSSRGRRMRLSIDAAKKFFGLQDLLGFDTASKTVEWLLKKSKNSIKELKHVSRTSSTSVLSAVDEVESEVATKHKTNEGKGVRKSAVFHPLARRRRENARARARERTLEKKRLQQVNLGSSKPSLSGENSATGSNYLNTSNILQVGDLLISREEVLVDDSFLITNNNWNPFSTIFMNYHEHNSETTSNFEHQFTAFQYDGKQWERY